MKTIVITDAYLNKYRYHKPDEDVDIFIEHGIRDGIWGDPDGISWEISDYDPDMEPKGVIIRDKAPGNPENRTLWMHRGTGNLYSWDKELEKWLSVDRAAFVPHRKLRSDSKSDLKKKPKKVIIKEKPHKKRTRSDQHD